MTRTSRCIRAGVLLAGLTVWFDAQDASSQSLGEVARREVERRDHVRSGRVYTNEDLAKVDPVQPQAKSEVPATTGNEPAAESRTNASGGVVEEDPAEGTVNINAPPATGNRDESYWRRRSRDLRERLASVNANIGVTERRLAGLEAKPQTPAATREREVAARALTQLQSERQLRTDDIAQLRTFAESQKVPPAWLELE